MTSRALLCLIVALAAGCSHVPRAQDSGTGEAACATLYAEVDRSVRKAGVQDGGSARIEGFPYLRVDRMHASFASGPLSDDQFAQWVARLGALDRDARRAELANLPAAERERLRARHGDLEQALDGCRDIESDIDLHAGQRRQLLRTRARVEDDYDAWKRVVGLYWLTRVPFASGVQGYQREAEAVFQTPLERLPVHGRLVAYAPERGDPLSPQEVAAVLTRAADNPLRVPDPPQDDLDRLFRTFAPIWVVDERDGNDRIGRLTLNAKGRPQVDTDRPVVYRRVAHTRVHDATLLQLVYSTWFPARPEPSAFDLLGGHLDGIVWRVTLAPDGTPLLFDSIHNCGCYHQFFPTPRAQPLPQPDTLDETAFIPQRLDAVLPGQPIVLRVEAGTHYLQRASVGAEQKAVSAYAFVPDDALRALPYAGGSRSAFRSDGIVPGSQRGERYFFWPMGVRDAGAMRQWGRHATAFVGRRHFDEARLMERYFRLDLQ
jgi:hypothetical protein